MIDWRSHIISNDAILLGKPTIKGTRISLELIIGPLADGWTEEDILRSYPSLQREDIGLLKATMEADRKEKVSRESVMEILDEKCK